MKHIKRSLKQSRAFSEIQTSRYPYRDLWTEEHSGLPRMVGGAYYIHQPDQQSGFRCQYRIPCAVSFPKKKIYSERTDQDLFRNHPECIRGHHRYLWPPRIMLRKTYLTLLRTTFAGTPKKMDEIIKQSLATLEELRTKSDGLTGVHPDLPILIASQVDGSLRILWSSQPVRRWVKTAFVLTCARNAAVDFKRPVVVFSLEMSSVQLVNRLISGETEIEQEKIEKEILPNGNGSNCTARLAP